MAVHSFIVVGSSPLCVYLQLLRLRPSSHPSVLYVWLSCLYLLPSYWLVSPFIKPIKRHFVKDTSSRCTKWLFHNTGGSYTTEACFLVFWKTGNTGSGSHEVHCLHQALVCLFVLSCMCSLDLRITWMPLVWIVRIPFTSLRLFLCVLSWLG